jgi:putative ABC transport system permease protein
MPAKLPSGVRRLFRLPLSRSRLLREMDEEIAAHLGMRIEELRAGGMSEMAAEAEARRRFGDDAEFRDYASRRAPALNALVVVTLALTIGATTAVYGVVRRLLLEPLACGHPEARSAEGIALQARPLTAVRSR